MGRIKLHRSECDAGWARFLMLTLVVAAFGFFSCLLVSLIDAETKAGIWAPLAQASLSDWTVEAWSQQAPLAMALLFLPPLAALAIGVHTLWQGGILGFLISLFNLLPFCALADGWPLFEIRATPCLALAFLLGAILAFYAGDVGSWICRRRMRRV